MARITEFAGRFLRTVLAYLPGTILALLLCEGLLRLMGAGHPGNLAVHTATESTLVGFMIPDVEQRPVYLPNTDLVYTYPDNPRGYFDQHNRVVGHVNALGYRGTAYPMARSGDAVRIAVLGDSFTLGYGVRDEHTFSAVMETALRDAGRDVEVLNFGVSGMNVAHASGYLEGYVARFRPDVAVMTFFLNDADRIGVEHFLNSSLLFPRVAQEHSRLANFVGATIMKQVNSHRLINHYRAGYQPDSLAWKWVCKRLRKMAAFCRDRDITFVLAIYPILFRLDSDYPFAGIHATLEGFAQAEGFPVVDLFPAVAGEDARALVVHPVDHHPNEYAQQRVGTYLAEALAPLLPDAPIVSGADRQAESSSTSR